MKRNPRRDARRNALVEQHVEWARAIACQVAGRMHACFEQDDLIGPAEFELVKQAAKYDPTRGVTFRQFAQLAIRGACLNSVRRWEWRIRSAGPVEDTAAQPLAADPFADAQLWRSVGRLPARHAEVVWQVYLNDSNLAEVGLILGIGESRASQIHGEALDMLKLLCRGLR